MKLWIVTLGYRRHGHAILSWYEAQKAYERAYKEPYLWTHYYGVPDDVTRYEFDGRVESNHNDGHDVVTQKYEDVRKLFLQSGYDVFVSIEDDMVIPPDALIRLRGLIEGGAHIGYGLYVWRGMQRTTNPNRWSAYTKLDNNQGLSISLDRDKARDAFGRVVDVVGVGMGCTAITCDVLDAVKFERRGAACNDWYLAIDAQAQGFTQRCDLGLVCGHLDNEISPRILYPDPEAEDMYRVDFI